MKKSLLVIALIAIMFGSCKKDSTNSTTTTTPAKYTISSGDVGTLGTYLMAIDTTNLTGFSLGDPGESKTWDFALAGDDKTDTIKFLAPSSTPADSSFPNSNLVLQMPASGQTSYAYLNKTDALAEIIGVYSTYQGMIISGSYTDRQIMMKFPAYFGTSFTDAGAVDAISYFSTYFTWVKLEMRSNYSSQIDASGKITTPAGTFDCIRDKRTEIQNQKMYSGITQTGPWTQQYETTDTTYTYAYYTKGKGYSVAEIKVGNFTTNTIKEIKYLK